MLGGGGYMWAIIGGSGFERFDGFSKVDESLAAKFTHTPLGQTSSGLKKATLDGVEIVFLPRHGQHHELMPSEINYRANIFALKALGVTKILSISAVGSLREELKPGEMVVPTQYINRTGGIRRHTFCGEGITGHVSLAKPVTIELVQEIEKMQKEFDFNIHIGKTYVCIEGPQFSTKAESHSYRQMGADIIGMTNFPEYALAREAGIGYLPCAFVTDYDCWDDNVPHVTLQQVLDIMRQNNGKAFTLAKALIKKTQYLLPNGCIEAGLASSLMCKLEDIPAAKMEWLSLLLNK